jgi:hypothetical protein
VGAGARARGDEIGLRVDQRRQGRLHALRLAVGVIAHLAHIQELRRRVGIDNVQPGRLQLDLIAQDLLLRRFGRRLALALEFGHPLLEPLLIRELGILRALRRRLELR